MSTEPQIEDLSSEFKDEIAVLISRLWQMDVSPLFKGDISAVVSSFYSADIFILGVFFHELIRLKALETPPPIGGPMPPETPEGILGNLHEEFNDTVGVLIARLSTFNGGAPPAMRGDLRTGIVLLENALTEALRIIDRELTRIKSQEPPDPL